MVVMEVMAMAVVMATIDMVVTEDMEIIVTEVMVAGATIIGTVNNQTGGQNLLKTMVKKAWFTLVLTTGMERPDSRTMMTLLPNM